MLISHYLYMIIKCHEHSNVRSFACEPLSQTGICFRRYGVDGLDRKAMGEGTHQGYHVVYLTHSEEPEM